jgi:hypothetical protein
MAVSVKITTEVRPFFNGRATNSGEAIEVTQAEADQIVKNGWGEVTKKAKPEKRVRARKDGKFVADDPDTPENEAWVNGS